MSLSRRAVGALRLGGELDLPREFVLDLHLLRGKECERVLKCGIIYIWNYVVVKCGLR